MVFVMTYSEGQEIINLPGVKAVLHDVAANTILPKASGLAAKAGLANVAADLRVVDGVRPKGRPYSRVEIDSDNSDAFEFGDSQTARYRILGGAAGVKLWPDL